MKISRKGIKPILIPQRSFQYSVFSSSQPMKLNIFNPNHLLIFPTWLLRRFLTLPADGLTRFKFYARVSNIFQIHQKRENNSTN